MAVLRAARIPASLRLPARVLAIIRPDIVHQAAVLEHGDWLPPADEGDWLTHACPCGIAGHPARPDVGEAVVGVGYAVGRGADDGDGWRDVVVGDGAVVCDENATVDSWWRRTHVGMLAACCRLWAGCDD